MIQLTHALHILMSRRIHIGGSAMSQGPRHVRPNRSAAAMLALLLAPPLAAAEPRSGEPREKPLNRLKGVVVTKADGRPVAGVTVAMAHATHGSLAIQNGGQI